MAWLPALRKICEVANTTSGDAVGRVLFRIRFNEQGRKIAMVGDYQLKSVDRIHYSPNIKIILKDGQSINIEQSDYTCEQFFMLDGWQAKAIIDADKKAGDKL